MPRLPNIAISLSSMKLASSTLPSPGNIAGMSQLNHATSTLERKEEAIFASNDGAFPLFFDFPSGTSYRCISNESGGESTEDNASGRIAKIIEFDYEIALKTGSDINSELSSFEEQLMNYVGLDLTRSGCRVKLSRTLRGKPITSVPHRFLPENKVIVDEISSQPKDEPVQDGGKCVI